MHWPKTKINSVFIKLWSSSNEEFSYGVYIQTNRLKESSLLVLVRDLIVLATKKAMNTQRGFYPFLSLSPIAEPDPNNLPIQA